MNYLFYFLRKKAGMLLCIVSLLGFGMINPVHSQEIPNFSFLVQINDTDNMIEVNGSRGCEWTNITFSLLDNETKFINNKEVTVAYDSTPNEELTMPNTFQKEQIPFTVGIRKIKGEIQLIGYNGTEWEEWSYKCKGESCMIIVNQQEVGLLSDIMSQSTD